MPKKKRDKTPKFAKKFHNSNKLELLLARSKISNSLVKFFRQRKTSKHTLKVSSKHKKNLLSPISNFLVFRKNLLLKSVFGLILIAICYGGWVFVKQYNSIEFSPYLIDSSEQSDDLRYFGPEYNVLLTGFQKSTNNRFAQMVLFVSINPKTGNMKVLSINPSFITSTELNKRYTLRSLINNVGSDDPANKYSKDVENLLGIRIDRYIAFDVEKFKNLLVDWNISMKTIDSFNSSVGFFNKDNSISKVGLGEYLFTLNSDQDYDLLANRQLSFFNQLVLNNRNLVFYFNAFWNAESLTDVFHTNMSKSEMSGFLTGLANSNVPGKTSVIDSHLGIQSNTGLEVGLAPNYIEFDARIKDVILNIDIIKEQVSIEVYNASKIAGYATKVKRIFQNMGGNIINTNNYPEKVEGVKLYVPNKNAEQFPNNISAIENYFGEKLQIIVGDYKYNHTGELILVLGE